MLRRFVFQSLTDKLYSVTIFPNGTGTAVQTGKMVGNKMAVFDRPIGEPISLSVLPTIMDGIKAGTLHNTALCSWAILAGDARLSETLP
jgi:hypothetical protein